MRSKKVRTTVALPEGLLAAVDLAVREGKAGSRNELVSAALRRELAALERARIDEEFGYMAGDAAYKAEAEEVVGDLDVASWEALRVAEDDAPGGSEAG